MDTTTQHGYLVLADISGYTSYLAGVELDHAHEILTDLLQIMVGKFKTLLTICKLEGDAVFAFAPETQVPRGETLLELIELIYAAFQDRITNSRRHTTCTCHACQNMNTLDLKFFIHHGDYMIQDVMGIRELVGSDVNLVHRLMKNHITENTGWRAYALLTERGLDHLSIHPDNLHQQNETYEHLGDTNTFTYDLKPRYQAYLESRRVEVTPQEAMVSMTFEYPAPVNVIWDWLNDPPKRALLANQDGLEFRLVHRPGGRKGIGARTHCMHGEQAAMKEVVLDWKPFEHFTVEQDGGSFGVIQMTYYLESIDDGNSTRLLFRIKGRLIPGFLNRLAVYLVYGKMFYGPSFKKLQRIITDEQPASSPTPQIDSV